MSITRRAGFDFGFDPTACTVCSGHCCCGAPGKVWVNQQEILEIARVLQINIVDCLQLYCNRVDNRLAVREQFSEHGLACIFFDGPARRCAIYSVRPEQCRRFPFWDHFKKHRDQLVRECPGIRERSDPAVRVTSGP